MQKLEEQDLWSNRKSSSYDQWSDHYKDSGWIFVGGLLYDLTKGKIITVFSQKNEGEEKGCHCKKSATKRNKDKENKENIQRIDPYTGQNVFAQKDAPGKENVKKKSNQKARKNPIPEISREKTLTKQVAIDCEMVGISDGKSMLARVSIVNRYGFCVYDKYVKPREPVQDYRTKVSGIRPHNLENGEEFKVVKKEVMKILRTRILVGHALKYDLAVLNLSHPRKLIRDSSRFNLFRQLSRGNTPSLKKLSSELLGKDIQTGEHSSIEDARAAMQLYVLYKNKWESEFYNRV